MTALFNDRYYLNLLLAVLFLAGVSVSIFLIYSLPANLHLADGYQSEFVPVYVVIGISFLLGAFSLTSSLRYKQEVIVMKDRVIDAASAGREASEQAGKTTISLDSVRGSLAQARGEKDILQAGLQAICKQLDAGQGAIYGIREEDGKRFIELKSGYALSMSESTVLRYEFGEGLVGQSAASARSLYIDDVPGGYIKIISGLGSASPRYLFIAPVKKDQLVGVLEVATFTGLSEDQRKFIEESAQLIAEKISTRV
jgi:methyl-accepting chemotaxis protein